MQAVVVGCLMAGDVIEHENTRYVVNAVITSYDGWAEVDATEQSTGHEYSLRIPAQRQMRIWESD